MRWKRALDLPVVRAIVPVGCPSGHHFKVAVSLLKRWQWLVQESTPAGVSQDRGQTCGRRGYKPALKMRRSVSLYCILAVHISCAGANQPRGVLFCIFLPEKKERLRVRFAKEFRYVQNQSKCGRSPRMVKEGSRPLLPLDENLLLEDARQACLDAVSAKSR